MESSRPKRKNAGSKIKTLIEKEKLKKEKIETLEVVQDVDEADEADEDFHFLGNTGEISDSDIPDSDFIETDSETEAASIEAMERIERLLAEQEKDFADKKKNRKKMIVPRFADLKKPKQAISNTSTKAFKQNNKSIIQPRSTLSLRENSIQSTKLSHLLHKQREEEKQMLIERRKSEKLSENLPNEPKLTQEMILEEAKITESQNINLLKEMITQQELVLKSKLNSMKFKKPELQFPVISSKSYISTRTEPSSSTDDVMNINSNIKSAKTQLSIKFNSEAQLKEFDISSNPILGCLKPSIVAKEKIPFICPVTGRPARYIHPKTGIPYANVYAYKVIEKLVSGCFAYNLDSETWIPNPSIDPSTKLDQPNL
ncbi:hypothetical protein BB560_000333 [Smittium megazygosporum]|uniref:Vps72/YL1 C-terminal domain-containing protein n=1 Tax=Smittium megazygosporum TaxID=133381 RepID=A0A2T9ZKQ8_9FUNG|nr:hypothetical protein BB560_000333 [Smittium megazygosporum]